ncbi:DUF2771 family protein [Gordonia sp. TBRC 11910]|uniref:DUF2771 family protein n=1 Tax=Gordonia asplenii TaxID=2725283 RepID=A0A848KRF4_9ACTN|nr:DUF2771 family protein [Gordonia asplenii]NMO01544.1 DUF2771 family protein [Gordonia asplenii]
MNFTAAERKTLAIIGVLILLFGAIVGGAAAVAAHATDSDDDHLPYVQVAVGDKLTRVYPLQWCDPLMRECQREPRSVGYAPVSVGQTALISVSKEIAQAPWALLAQYYTPRGAELAEHVYLSNSQYTVALASTRERTLVNIEIHAASAVETPQGIPSRGVLAADTTPKKEAAER